MRKALKIQPISEINDLDSKKKKFIPIIEDLNPFLPYLNATELHLMIYFSSKFHMKINGEKWKKTTDVFSVSQLQNETGRHRREIKSALLTLLEIGFIKFFSLKNHQIFIALNTPENKNISKSPVANCYTKQNNACSNLLHENKKPVAIRYNSCSNSPQSVLQFATRDRFKTPVFTRVSELPKNIKELYKNYYYYKKENPLSENDVYLQKKHDDNDYKNNNKNEINFSDTDLSFLDDFIFEETVTDIKKIEAKNKYQETEKKIEPLKTYKASEIANVKNTDGEEGKVPGAGFSISEKIFNTLEAWGWAKFDGDSREKHLSLMKKKAKEFTDTWSEEMLYQMIEVTNANPELRENANKCRYLSKLMKDPENFSYSPELISTETHNKIEAEKDQLKKIKQILGIKVSMPADILQEALEKLITHTEKKLTGYQKYAENKAREYFAAMEKMRPLNPEQKQEYLNKQYDIYEADRQVFIDIAKKLFDSYNPNALKTLITQGFKDNPQPGKIRNFASGNINSAVLKILRSLSDVSGNNIKFLQSENENKIIRFQEMKSQKPVKPDGLQSVKNILSGYVPYLENNPELLDYIAKNISLEG